MPLSMAACRTVLPFSTVTCRPSIVSVTVSISDRSYQPSRRAGAIAGRRIEPDPSLDDRPASPSSLLIVDAAERAGRAGRAARRLRSVTGTTTSIGLPVGVLQRHGDGHVEELADLLDAQHDVCRAPSRRGS